MRDELSIDDIALITAKELWPGKDATEQNAGLIASAIRGAIASCRPARLVAELAESVRALAVSQGEVAEAKADANGWMKVYGKQIQTSAGLALKLSEAKELLARLVGPDDCNCADNGTPCAYHDARAFLAPIASPEPDRASPEVTATNQGETK